MQARRGLTFSPSFLALLLAVSATSHAAPASVSGTDPFNDQVNPVLGFKPPVLGYQNSSVDIRSWSLAANGSQIDASVTVQGNVTAGILLQVGGVMPGLMVLFETPRLSCLLPCDLPRQNGTRFGLYFQPGQQSICYSSIRVGGPAILDSQFPATDYSYLVEFEPNTMEPQALVAYVPYEVSTDKHTVTWHLPYTFDGVTVAEPGDVLTNASALTMTWTAQGTNCAYEETPDGMTDWAPQSSWDAIQRVLRPTGLDVQA